MQVKPPTFWRKNSPENGFQRNCFTCFDSPGGTDSKREIANFGSVSFLEILTFFGFAIGFLPQASLSQQVDAFKCESNLLFSNK